MVLIEHLVLVGLFIVQRLLQNALTNIENQPLSSEDSSNNDDSLSVSPSIDSVEFEDIHDGLLNTTSECHEQRIIRKLHDHTISAENSHSTVQKEVFK